MVKLQYGVGADKLGIAVIDSTITAEILQPIRFQGQFFDVETGLHYNRFRYYDNDCGMFISRDLGSKNE